MVVDSCIARSVVVANIGTSPYTRLGKWLVIGLTEQDTGTRATPINGRIKGHAPY